jgi:CRP/FNR family transcriptional regulator, nitrogen fixation regulation protein
MLSTVQKAPASKLYSLEMVSAGSAAVTLSPQLLDPLVSLAAIVTFDRDDEIVFQGDDAEYCYEVVSGCVRTVRLLEDGRRHVGEFLFAGDLLGCDSAQQYEFGAEAVTPATLRRYRASAIEERAETDLAFAQRLRRHSASQVRAARGRLMLLGRKTASERIASFLIEMQTRLRPSGPGAIDLPMSRGDIADYLGLTIETICRGLADMRQLGIIAVDRARIVILDRCGLARAGSDQIH